MTRFPLYLLKFGLGSALVLGLTLILVWPCLAFAATDAANDATDGAVLLSMDSGLPQSQRRNLPVSFNHDRHTALIQTDASLNCFVCHTDPASMAEDSEELPFQFFKGTEGAQGTAGSDKEDLYHNACISCHEDQNFSADSGPNQVQCRSCHDGAASGESFAPLFSKSLHYRHINAPVVQAASRELLGQDALNGESSAVSTTAVLMNPESPANCVACHHEVRRAMQNSYPGDPQPTPENCKSCHFAGPGTATNTSLHSSPPSFEVAAHDSCLSCHTEQLGAGLASGPVDCASCHDPALWASLSENGPEASLYVGQPVSLQLNSPKRLQELEAATSSGQSSREILQSSMPSVGFNHNLHENVLPACGSCHHSTVRQACSDCHTPLGSDQGGGVNLAQAMHSSQGPFQSCVSCHNELKTTTPQCAGCHVPQPVSQSLGNCSFCHRSEEPALPALSSPESAPVVEYTSSHASASGPASALEQEEALPQILSLGLLKREYQAVEFDHEEHMERLMGSINQGAPSWLAAHQQDYALCASCHHNSPASATPPKCASCHQSTVPNAQFIAEEGKPLLKAAYHQLCMSCHTRMDITSVPATDCASCHDPVSVAAQ